jgi:rieske iron-sulfur protein
MRIKEEKPPAVASACERCCERINRRRAILSAGVGLSLVPALLLGQPDPASEPPQTEDFLVKQSDAAHKPLRPDDIAVGASPAVAWPMTPTGRIVRSQNRFNALLLIRLDPATMSSDTKSVSAAGVLAFSALCPHAGCTIDQWVPERRVLECDCHSSEFDPRETGKVVDGPASRPLPPLALKLVDGTLVVAKPFAVPIQFDEQ